MSVFAGLPISSESLLGDVGREFPGLKEKEIIAFPHLFHGFIAFTVGVKVFCVSRAPLNGTPLPI